MKAPTNPDTEKYIERRAEAGSEEKYKSVLKKTPHMETRADDIID